MNKSELLELQAKLTKRQEEANSLKGENKAVLKRLQQEHGCTSTREAKKLVKQLQKKITALSTTYKNLVDDIEALLAEEDEDE